MASTVEKTIITNTKDNLGKVSTTAPKENVSVLPNLNQTAVEYDFERQWDEAKRTGYTLEESRQRNLAFVRSLWK